jgi:hypothetical protein
LMISKKVWQRSRARTIRVKSDGDCLGCLGQLDEAEDKDTDDACFHLSTVGKCANANRVEKSPSENCRG